MVGHSLRASLAAAFALLNLVIAAPTTTISVQSETTITGKSTTATYPVVPATPIPGLPTSCATTAPAAPSQSTISNVRTANISVPYTPFGLVYANESHAFVSLPNGTRSVIGVLDTSSFTPRLIRQIPLPKAFVQSEGGQDVVLSHDRRQLFIAAGPGAVIYDVAKAIAGDADAVIGTLSGGSTGSNPDNVTSGTGVGAIQITLTNNTEFAFISQEYGVAASRYFGDLDVFKLRKPNKNGNITDKHVGDIFLGAEVVGSVLSPDEKTIYVTSESSFQSGATPGLISVLDVASLKKNNTKNAVKSAVQAGCGPVRAILSGDGKTLWVTARESDLLLAYDTEKMVSDPVNSLITKVQVGTAPVGLTFARNESLILTADSDRFNATGAVTGISVIDVEKALSGQADTANYGRIPTGLFPRQFAVSPDGNTILVTLHDSREVQAIDVTTLP